MGKELEYKLQIPDRDTLSRIMADPQIVALMADAWRETPMRTEYYDSPDGRFSGRHWTFRLRQEGDQSIVCVKTPTPEAHTRGEWQISASEINEEVVHRLIEIGTPVELLYLYGAGDITPVCGARFLRSHCMLRFDDGSRAEIACDEGSLLGKTQRMSFLELELELYEGDPGKMLELIGYLCSTYALKEQPRSKHARARSLN